MARGRMARAMVVLGGVALLQLGHQAFVPGPSGRSKQLRSRTGASQGVSRQAGLDDWSESFTAESDHFKEMDRRERRDVFSYQAWKQHRSTSRYFKNLVTAFSSSLARFVWIQVLACTVFAAAVWLYFEGFGVVATFFGFPAAVASAFPGHDAPAISALPFSVTVAVLSLLLVFRTNQSYDRWWEARKIWGSIVNKTRDITRQGLTRVPPQQEHLKQPITALAACFPKVLMFHLGAQDDQAKELLEKDLTRLLPENDRDTILAATHKPMTLVGCLSEKFAEAHINPIERMKADNILTDFSDYYGMCERILKTPIPLVYTRFTSRFLSVWMLLLPLALYSQTNPHFLIVPITGLIGLFLFAIAEVGIQIEEPFSILPLQSICDGIEASCFEAYELDKKKEPINA
eukprot:gb/GFBE01054221.1/.p1 GENE.gb/GFBE01054221.1/~~gb/GFBE01054221.1/.p1  ORF type:complete len:403 (+),score=63.12 gb/GFBE01054221.1/:1-1209(+)